MLFSDLGLRDVWRGRKGERASSLAKRDVVYSPTAPLSGLNAPGPTRFSTALTPRSLKLSASIFEELSATSLKELISGPPWGNGLVTRTSRASRFYSTKREHIVSAWTEPALPHRA